MTTGSGPGAENPVALLQSADMDLWMQLIQDAEPLPNPKRGLFKFHGRNLRMPKRGSDGKVSILTEQGEVLFQGPLLGPLIGSESRLVQTLNRKVQEIQNRSPQIKQVQKSREHHAETIVTPQADGTPSKKSQATSWREVTSTFEKVDLERRIQRLDDLGKESPDHEDFISDPNGTSVTATVVKAGKPRLPARLLAPFERIDKNVVDDFETWSRTVPGVVDSRDRDRINERLRHGKNESDLPVSCGDLREHSRSEIGVDVFQVNGDDNKTSTQMIMLHNYVTVQGQSLEEGEEVSFLMSGERGWAQVIDRRDTKSWVPRSYLQELVLDTDSPDSASRTESTGSAIAKCKNSDIENENHHSHLQQSATESNLCANQSPENPGTKTLLELLRENEKLKERIKQLESLADVRLVFELQRELQRERHEREAERKALESDIIRSREELNESKERCRALEALSEATRSKFAIDDIQTIRPSLLRSLQSPTDQARFPPSIARSRRGSGIAGTLEENSATRVQSAEKQETTAAQPDWRAADERAALEKALEDERARGAAWQETTEELMVQNERLRECIQEQQAELQARACMDDAPRSYADNPTATYIELRPGGLDAGTPSESVVLAHPSEPVDSAHGDRVPSVFTSMDELSRGARGGWREGGGGELVKERDIRLVKGWDRVGQGLDSDGTKARVLPWTVVVDNSRPTELGWREDGPPSHPAPGEPTGQPAARTYSASRADIGVLSPDKTSAHGERTQSHSAASRLSRDHPDAKGGSALAESSVTASGPGSGSWNAAPSWSSTGIWDSVGGVPPYHTAFPGTVNGGSPWTAERAGPLDQGTRPGLRPLIGLTDSELWSGREQAKPFTADRDQRQLYAESDAFGIEPIAADRGQHSVAAALETWLQRSPPLQPARRDNAEHLDQRHNGVPLEQRNGPGLPSDSSPLHHARPRTMTYSSLSPASRELWGRMSDSGSPVDRMDAASTGFANTESASLKVSASRLLAGLGTTTAGVGALGYSAGNRELLQRSSVSIAPPPRGFRSPGSPLSQSLKSQFV
jgi:hypothetical protein